MQNIVTRRQSVILVIQADGGQIIRHLTSFYIAAWTMTNKKKREREGEGFK